MHSAAEIGWTRRKWRRSEKIGGARGGVLEGDRETHTEIERDARSEEGESEIASSMLAHNTPLAGCLCALESPRDYVFPVGTHRLQASVRARALAPGHTAELRTKPTANDSSNFRKLLWDTRRGIQGTGAAARNAVSPVSPRQPSFARYHFPPPPPLEQHRYPSFSVREITPLDIPSRSRPISIPPPRRFPTSGTAISIFSDRPRSVSAHRSRRFPPYRRVSRSPLLHRPGLTFRENGCAFAWRGSLGLVVVSV